jgi:hypothetical protein
MADIRITITGAQGAGKTRFLRRVLIPALRISEIPYVLNDEEDRFYCCSDSPKLPRPPPPEVDVFSTNDEIAAIKHILDGSVS